MHFHKPQEKPSRWGSFADVQYAIRVNSEKIYGCDPEDDVLVMPLFWGLPCLDYSMYNNHGTNHGATYKAGSLDFDGGDDYVGIDGTNFITSPSAITVSVWARPNSLTVDQRLITRFGLDIQFVLWMDQGGTGEGWAWAVRDSSSSQINLGENNADAVTTRLQHIVGTVESGGNSKIYVDGQETGTVNFANPIQTSAIDIWIGAMDLSTDQFFNGTIGEVRISKATRTADQIGLFYERPYDLYRRVGRVIWSIPSGLTLTIAAIDGAGLLDNVVLTQKHNLTVQELSGAGSLDNVSLTQKHLLALQELLSSGVLDNVALIQKHLLSVQELSSAGALDNIDLTQKHTLAVQSLLSAGTLDAIELILATLLVVSDLLSTGALDSTELMQKHVLTVQEVLSVGTLDIATLTQKQLLIINNLLSSGLIDKINFDIVSGLIYISLSQATEYNISLSQATEYNISLSQATEYNISLSQAGGGA